MKMIALRLALFVGQSASAQADEDDRREARRAKEERLWALEKRIYETRPQRRDAPLREQNIRDEEVAEIQAAARSVLPEAIVNISGVVVGCPCEEGPSCADQVWILASRADKTIGLQLSKIGNHWTIGLIQRWWWEYEKLQARRDDFRTYTAYADAEDRLKEQFPNCLAAPSGKPLSADMTQIAPNKRWADR